MPALPLTPEQLADAARLKTKFEQWKLRRKEEGQPGSQMALGHLLEMNQSAVSQYLNGNIPLNAPVAAKFAKVFGCQIDDFSETLAKEAQDIGEAVTALIAEGAASQPMDLTTLSKFELQLVLLLRELPGDARDEVMRLAKELMTPGASLPPSPPPASPGASEPAKRPNIKLNTFLSG